MAKRRKKGQQRDPLGQLQSEWTEEEEDDGIVADGGRIRVGLQFMDSLQKAVAKDAPTSKLLVDAGTDDPLALHKPGFRYSTNAADRLSGDVALAEAYEARELADREAWRSSVPEQRADARSVEDAYRQYDVDMAEAWRG